MENEIKNSRTFKKKSLLLTLVFFSLLLASFLSFRPDRVYKLKDNYVSVVYDKETKSATFTITDKKPDSWVELSEVSEKASWAVVISEDWAFYEHVGLDFKQVQKALNNHIEGAPLRGASTLTQQLAKNVFLSQERSFTRKIREAGIALTMEQVLEKDQILEHYLNVVEFGEGIYGISQASEFYFNKVPSKLNAKEGAFLAMLLPSPKKHATSFEQKEMTPYALEVTKDILNKLNQAKIIDDKELKQELTRTLSFIPQLKVNKTTKPKKRKAPSKPRTKEVISMSNKKLNDGRDFELQYMSDSDLALAPVEEFDPSKLEKVELDVDVEFSLE